MAKRIPRYKDVDGWYLDVDDRHEPFCIGWCDPDDGEFGTMLSNDVDSRACGSELATANNAVRQYCIDNNIALPERCADFEFDSLKDAKAALRVANAALHYAAENKPLPDWAQRAAAAGWTPPKGWKP